MKSVRTIYKMGMGPSSSHTMGPAFAAKTFKDTHPEADRFTVILYGSLAKTGKGHGTDRAIIQALEPIPAEIVFHCDDSMTLVHPNTMELIALDAAGCETGRMQVLSVGGGDIEIVGRPLPDEAPAAGNNLQIGDGGNVA